jgi:hypothetical protein
MDARRDQRRRHEFRHQLQRRQRMIERCERVGRFHVARQRRLEHRLPPPLAELLLARHRRFLRDHRQRLGPAPVAA